MVLQVACDGDADVVLGVLVVLVVHDGGVLLFHVGVLPLVAPHCHKSTRYTRTSRVAPHVFESVL